MKRELFAIGDVHGQITLFQQMLTNWNEETQQLLLIGDLGDRGENPKDCFILAQSLVEKKDAIYLKGNHEDMLLAFLKHPEQNYDLYCLNGGMKTLETFLHPGLDAEYSPTEIVMFLNSRYPTLQPFLESLPLYYEWGRFLFVHAGVDLSKSDWHQTSSEDYVWIRDVFHKAKNTTGKIIVFGHTITPFLYGDNQTTDLWIKDNKIGIDGGAVYGGALHGVLFNEKELVRDIKLDNKGYVWDGLT
ncbi:metallophosphoesterase [Carnobacterium sp. 17-4]|uniref:metallophosphoesterase n=1 Tax=Carnobacterium sp. (strain 17-4) TaxID=208596 RepID=UPI0005A1268C|nr:metallophosphoesterase [Carnobacterium sp. 17-4]